MNAERSAPPAQEEVRRPREVRVTGLADLVPDWILPPESKQHLRNARKELLLAVRSVLDRMIEHQERGGVRTPPRRIEIETGPEPQRPSA